MIFSEDQMKSIIYFMKFSQFFSEPLFFMNQPEMDFTTLICLFQYNTGNVNDVKIFKRGVRGLTKIENC